jgi:hypothetical protein
MVSQMVMANIWSGNTLSIDITNADSCPSRTVIPIHRGQRSCDCGQFLKIV